MAELITQVWVRAMKATRDRYAKWLNEPESRTKLELKMGKINHCSMCKTASKIAGSETVEAECRVCPVAVISSSYIKCVGSCCYPSEYTVKTVKLRKRYYDLILERFKDDKCKTLSRLEEIVLEVEEDFKKKLKVKED